jgi:tetratricopeptide (TPR) repeat protein
MKWTGKLLSPFIFLSFAVLCFYFLFYYQFVFNIELNNNGHYFAAFVTLSCWTLFLIILLLLRGQPDTRQGLIMLIITAYILYLLTSYHYSFSNEYFTIAGLILILYALLLFGGIKVLHAVLIFLLVMFFWQLLIASTQIQQLPLNPGKGNIRGSLQNSGVFSFYIVSQLPFLYYLLFNVMKPAGIKQRPKLKYMMPFIHVARIIVFTLVFGFVTFVIWKSQSRTALIALGVLMTAFFFMNYGKALQTIIYKLPKAFSLSVACILFVGMIYALQKLFYLKKLSAIGRVMAVDISTDHIKDHFWLGTGIGRFTWYYPQWQSQYFLQHPDPPKDYFLSAGESYIIFNEYVQLFQTIGFPGFIVFIWFFICFFRTKSTSHKNLLNTAKFTVITILMCGLTSYPFQVNVMLLLLAFCFSIAAKVNAKKKTLLKLPIRYPGIWKILLIVFAAIAGVGSFFAFEGWQAKRALDQLRNRFDDSRINIKNDYARLNKKLGNNGKFLTEYGFFLKEDKADARDAANILEKAKKHFISRVTIESLAQAYKQTGDYQKAIENYEWLSHYLPNRFGIKLELLKLYNHVNDTASVRKTGHTILTMPVKISSSEVDRIKQETGMILRGLSN